MVPVAGTLSVAYIAVAHHMFAVDFHHAFWPAGLRTLHGQSPYVSPDSLAVRDGVAFVYPAAGALFFSLFALLPHAVADGVFAASCLLAAIGTLGVLGVRDWRLYGLILLWPPVISGWQTANLSLLLALGIAVMWRVRDRPAAVGLMLGLLIAVKVFVWPLGIWLLATRRSAAFGWAVASALVFSALAWLILGIDQVHAYAAVVNAASRVEEAAAYTPLALVLHFTSARGVAFAVEAVLAAAAIFACVRWGRRSDLAALSLAICISLLTTPTLWLHYLVLLLIPLAIARPRLGPIWALPLLLFACPVTGPVVWQLLLALGVSALVVTTAVRETPNDPVDLAGDHCPASTATTGRTQRRAQTPADSAVLAGPGLMA